jgi:FtsP/CotA-like multicopper oxidase with cupredoxin domain
MATRREFIKWTAASGAALAAGGGLLNERAGAARAAPAASAAPTLTPYMDPMPILVDNLIDARGGGTVDISTSLITRKLHSQLNPTTLFGYLWAGGPTAGKLDASYLGPVIVAKSGTPVTVNYHNGLAADAYLSVFKGGSSYTQFNANGTRILTHLHGAIDSGDNDGNPFATPGAYGPGAMQTAMYPNPQPATLSWYHDHLLGDTRMNVVGGLAGGYLLRDTFDDGSNPLLPNNNNSNGKLYELPMVVQDRQFNTDGSLLYPTAPASTNGPWIGEYFGDVMMVNGMIWPKLTVEPAVYRFRILNGCNARILNLRIARSNDQVVPTYIIGTEGGLLPLNPNATNSLVMAPAERFDVICDFRGLGGQTLLMKNTNLPSGVVSSPAPTLATVMQINVAKTASAGAPMTIPPAGSLKDPLVLTPVKDLTDLGAPLLSGGTVKGRMITLNEFAAGTPDWQLNLNGYPYGATKTDGTPLELTETLTWNNFEDWYFVNFTPDTHPMHTHLFSFRVMGRYNFDVKGYVAQFSGKAGVQGAPPDVPPKGVAQQNVDTLTPFLKSKLKAPPPEETGLKETVKVNPGQVTVVRAKFIPPPGLGSTTQRYVHHCHIVEHEDNDMMERVIVQP